MHVFLGDRSMHVKVDCTALEAASCSQHMQHVLL